MAKALMPAKCATRAKSFPVNDMIETTCILEFYRAGCRPSHVILSQSPILLQHNL
jgi:hypothetical protein